MNLDQRLKMYLQQTPVIAENAYVAKSAELIGHITVGNQCSIWPQAVLRADINKIVIGEVTNIQDGVIIHLADDYPCVVGIGVTVGHGAILHACKVEDHCLIGMRATILDGAVIGEGSIVGAGALVTQGVNIPSRSLVLGVPAKVVRAITEDELQHIYASAKKYAAMAQFYKTKY